MMPNERIVAYSALLLSACMPAGAQTLQRRIDASAAPSLQFHFAGRPVVCGDGRTYMRIDNDSWMGNGWAAGRSAPCERGPVRVLLVRAGREIIRIESYAGPLTNDSTAADLGNIAASDASAYLMSLALSAEGRVARDALTGAALADSSDNTKGLLALSRDQNRGRELRRSALGWLVRQSDERGAGAIAEVVRTVSSIAHDENESNGSRQQALGLLSRVGRGEGIPELISLAGQGGDVWLARQSVDVLSRSGDPRARRTLRELISNANASAEVRIAAFSGLANEYGTPADVDLIRAAYPSLVSDRARDAALSAVSTVGSGAARTWLSSIVRDREQAMHQRKRAAELLERAGASTADLTKLYDEIDETDIRSALIEQLAQAGTRDATTKLIAIARAEPNLAVRRRAVSVLSRSEDPRVKEVLQGVVERP
ncbi:MAG: HEAT repeat domain-containing protein [Gemmatimonadaceae bacterium]